jgi:hypothetical protein
VSDVSSRRSARAQAAAGQQQFQQIANHCWLTAIAVVWLPHAKPNECSWSRMFDLEQNLQHQSTCLNQNCAEEWESVPEQMSNHIYRRDGQSI